jgi:hypothetical protein
MVAILTSVRLPGLIRMIRGERMSRIARRIAMKDDPIVDAVRRARHQNSESVGHDPRKLVEYYQEFQKQFADRLRGDESPRSAVGDDSVA